jgi:hypothetical protein
MPFPSFHTLVHAHAHAHTGIYVHNSEISSSVHCLPVQQLLPLLSSNSPALHYTTSGNITSNHINMISSTSRRLTATAQCYTSHHTTPHHTTPLHTTSCHITVNHRTSLHTTPHHLT